MTRESHVPSLTLRLFSTIVLGFMLVSVITLYITNYLKDFTLNSILREYRQVQVMYADEITRQLAQAQERITSLGSSYLVDMGTSVEALQDERQYEAVRCQNEISTSMKTGSFSIRQLLGITSMDRRPMFSFSAFGAKTIKAAPGSKSSSKALRNPLRR